MFMFDIGMPFPQFPNSNQGVDQGWYQHQPPSNDINTRPSPSNYNPQQVQDDQHLASTQKLDPFQVQGWYQPQPPSNQLDTRPSPSNYRPQEVQDDQKLASSQKIDPCKLLNTFGSKKAKTLLPLNYEPSPFTVMVGRTKECQEHPGNKRLRQIVQKYLTVYNGAPDKVEKTAIVTTVYNEVRAPIQIGHFVKREKGRWYEVGERSARERIGAMFRDCLHQKYRSSSKNKVAMRVQKAKKAREEEAEDFEDFSNIFD